MKLTYLAILMLSVSSLTHAQVETDALKLAASSDDIGQVITAEKELNKQRHERLKAEKDPVKKKAMYFQGGRDIKTAAKKILELAKRNPTSDSAMIGLNWIYSSLVKSDRKSALNLLVTHHKDDEKIIKFLARATPQKELSLPELRSVMTSSNNEKVRQATTIILADALDTPDKESEESLALYKQVEAWPDIAETNPELYSHVTLYLYKAKNFSIGKVAPNIIGTDHDGKEFQLSDYKGKVVLIDFWGIW